MKRLSMHTLQYSALLLISWLSLCLMGTGFAAQATNQLDQKSFEKIYRSALLANASYQTEAQVKNQLEEGYVLDKSLNINAYGLACYLATRQSTREQIIIFRGTSNIENALVDAAFEFRHDPHTGIKLHQGFALSADYAYQALKPYLKTEYTLHTTGHSLGGAIALIVAMHADKDNFKTGQIVTFGQPKVTNVSGSHQYKHLDVIRVVLPKDMVPLVPPLDPVNIDPMNLQDMDIYWHQGIEIILQESNRYSVLSGVKSVMRATDFLNESISEQNLHHHMMQLYLESLDNKRHSPQEVPYKNSFNLFKLFGL